MDLGTSDCNLVRLLRDGRVMCVCACWARGILGVASVAGIPVHARPEGSDQMGIPLGAWCGSES